MPNDDKAMLASESAMSVATDTTKDDDQGLANVKKPLIALILAFSQREKGPGGTPISIPMTCSFGSYFTEIKH